MSYEIFAVRATPAPKDVPTRDVSSDYRAINPSTAHTSLENNARHASLPELTIASSTRLTSSDVPGAPEDFGSVNHIRRLMENGRFQANGDLTYEARAAIADYMMQTPWHQSYRARATQLQRELNAQLPANQHIDLRYHGASPSSAHGLYVNMGNLDAHIQLPRQSTLGSHLLPGSANYTYYNREEAIRRAYVPSH